MARLLLAEDQDPTRKTFAMALEAAGHHVVEASDGVEALQQLDAGASFDLLLTDVDMPGMSGIELATEALSRRPGLLIVIMSAHGDAGFRGADRLANAVKARITKPIAVKDLLATIAAALEAR